MKFLTFIVFILFSFNLANANNLEFIGVIGAAIGDIKNQKNEKLSNGSKIFYGDTIVVNEQSNAQLLFLDQTVITLGENQN